jgi:uncharacterized membrane protein
MSNKPNKRSRTADILKGIAVIAMVQVHVLEQFALPGIYDSLSGRISLFIGGPFCAPVFMAVMGYFLASGKKSASSMLWRGILLFTVGILLNILRSANLLLHIARGEISLNPMHYILGADILSLAGLSIILIAFLRSALPGKPGWFLALAFFFSAAGPLLPSAETFPAPMQYILTFVNGGTAWSYFPLYPWFSYVLLGYSFRLLPVNFLEKFREAGWQRLFLFLLLADILVTLIPASELTSDLEAYYNHGIIFFIWMILFLAAWLVIVSRLALRSGRLTGFLEWAGREVTLLYVIQWIIIGNLATEFYRSLNVYALLGAFVLVMSSTCALAMLVKALARLFHHPQV